MIKCKCPKCATEIHLKAGQFGEVVNCSSCSHSWTLDTENIARFLLPEIIIIHIEDVNGTRIPDKPIDIEYNYPKTNRDSDCLLLTN